MSRGGWRGRLVRLWGGESGGGEGGEVSILITGCVGDIRVNE